MTPFGERVRRLRRERGVSQRDMAVAIGVSPAYLSALEHGRRGVPNWGMVQKIIGFFNIIWDDAEELQRLAERSDPRIVIDTAGLSARATELSNLLAETISSLGEADVEAMIRQLREAQNR
jgi:transcriptional regulator with XRE-family HTH domain